MIKEIDSITIVRIIRRILKSNISIFIQLALMDSIYVFLFSVKIKNFIAIDNTKRTYPILFIKHLKGYFMIEINRSWQKINNFVLLQDN